MARDQPADRYLLRRSSGPVVRSSGLAGDGGLVLPVQQISPEVSGLALGLAGWPGS
jgi:hypothetical protein